MHYKMHCRETVAALEILRLGEKWFREHVALLNLPPRIRTTILEAIADRLCLPGQN